MVSEPSRRRAALRIGLQGLHLPESQILAALRLWDEDYAPTRPAALAEYVKDLALRLGYSIEERHQLRVALYVAIARHDGRIVPATSPPMPGRAPLRAPNGVAHAASPATAPVATSRGPAKSPAFVVFFAMAADILKAVQRAGVAAQDDFTQALEQHCSAQRLPVDVAVALGRWSRGGASLALLATHPADGFAAALHAIYAAAAEAVGPAEADRQLARAATAAEALPEAEAFAPHRLL